MTDVEQGRDEPSSRSSAPDEPLVPWIAPDEHAELRARRRHAASKGKHRRRHRSAASPKLQMATVAAAGVSGLATAGSATGIAAADRLLRGGLAAATAATAAMAPTWVVVVLSTGAAALGWTAGPLGATAGAAALVVAVVLAVTEKVDRELLKAAAGALSVTALLRAPGGPTGVTAAATGLLAGLVVVMGLRCGPRRLRRPARLAACCLLGLAALGAVLGGVAGLLARASFQRSSTETATALAAARAGDAPGAAASARVAAGDLRQAQSSLTALWAKPAWVVPIVGAHLRAGDEVARSAGPAVEAAAASADVLRLDILRPQAGRLDLARIAAAEPQLTRLARALHTAQRGAARARSPWLLQPLQSRLGRYDAQLGSLTSTSDRVLLAVQALPQLLGAEHPTRWFIAVANPAESRDLGGFIGDYAIVTADHGAVRLERSGSVSEIGADQTGRTLAGLDLPKRFTDQRPEVFWQNLSSYPDLPTVATAARKLWDQVEPGSPIDGVAYVDPHGLAALLQLTGPVQAPAPLGTLTSANAAKLLLEDQYSRFSVENERKDVLHDAVRATFTALSGLPLPGPGPVGAALGPAVQGGHILATSFTPQGQRLFDAIGAAGRLPAPDGRDLASLRTANLLPNKMDAHVRRTVRYQAEVDPAGHRVRATATIELKNDGTAALADYVAANTEGLPKATSVLSVAWYSGLGVEAAEVDGRPVGLNSVNERGWWTHTAIVTVPPGATVTVVYRLAGRLASTRPYRLAVSPQAGVTDDLYTVEVTGRPGWKAAPVPTLTKGRRTDLVVPLRS